MEADGSDQTRLTNSDSDNYEPAWSPDRTKIAFTSDRNMVLLANGNPDLNTEIYVMNANGSNLMRLTNDAPPPLGSNRPVSPDFKPSWSPDGTKIAFSHGVVVNNRIIRYEIWVMDADGSNQMMLSASPFGIEISCDPQRIKNTGYAGDFDPAWSPDGNRIAFWRRIVGNPPSTSAPGISIPSGEIWVMDPDGSNQVRVSPTPADPDECPRDFEPAWSPDELRLAFYSLRDGGAPEIYVMDADGSNQRRLTDDLSSNDRDPVWSPDGSQIAFRSTQQNLKRIAVIDSNGSAQTNLTNSGTFPAWSPLLP